MLLCHYATMPLLAEELNCLRPRNVHRDNIPESLERRFALRRGKRRIKWITDGTLGENFRSTLRRCTKATSFPDRILLPYPPRCCHPIRPPCGSILLSAHAPTNQTAGIEASSRFVEALPNDLRVSSLLRA